MDDNFNFQRDLTEEELEARAAQVRLFNGKELLWFFKSCNIYFPELSDIEDISVNNLRVWKEKDNEYYNVEFKVIGKGRND